MSSNNAKVFRLATIAVMCMGMVAGMTGCGDSDKNATSISDINLGKYVDMADYHLLAITVPAMEEINDALVADYVNYYFNSASASASRDNLITDKAAKLGDLVNIDYAGYKDGVAFEGGTASDQTLLLGSHSFIDGFEDGLVGVMPGDTVDLDLTFPEVYQSEELAGADVVFTVTVHGIIPEKDIIEAWNASYGKGFVAQSKADLNSYYAEKLKEDAQAEYDTNIDDAIIDEIMEITSFKKDFPESLVQEYKDNAQLIIDNYAAMYGVDNNTIAQYMFGMTEDAYVNQRSMEQLKIDAAFFYIAEKENLLVGRDEITGKILDYYAENGMEIAADDITDDMKENYLMYFNEVSSLDYLRSIAEVNVE